MGFKAAVHYLKKTWRGWALAGLLGLSLSACSPADNQVHPTHTLPGQPVVTAENPTATVTPTPTPTPEPTPPPIVDQHPHDGYAELVLDYEGGQTILLLVREAIGGAVIAGELTPDQVVESIKAGLEVSFTPLTAEVIMSIALEPGAPQASVMLLEGEVEDSFTDQIYRQPISFATAINRDGSGEGGLMPLGWREQVVAYADAGNNLFFYQREETGEWQFVATIPANSNGIRYRYDASQIALVAEIGEDVIPLEPSSRVGWLHSVEGASIDIEIPDPNSEASKGVMSANELQQVALNFLERIKTHYRVTQARFDTINLNFSTDTNIWQLTTGSSLTNLETQETITADENNYVYVIQTTEGIKVLQLDQPIEEVKYCGESVPMDLSANLYQFGARVNRRGEIEVTATSIGTSEDETEIYVLRIDGDGHAEWVEEVEEVAEVLDMGEVFRTEQYGGVLNTPTTDGRVSVQVLTDYTVGGRLLRGTFVHQETGAKGVADLLVDTVATKHTEAPTQVVSINRIQAFLNSLMPEDLAKLTNRDGAIVISVLDLQDDATGYQGWEEFSADDFDNTTQLISIGEELERDTGSTVSEQDRYVTLNLMVNGEMREVKVAMLFGYRTDNNLQAHTAFAYTNPETGENVLITISRVDQQMPSYNSTEFSILKGLIRTLRFLNPSFCPPEIIINMARSGDATILVDQDLYNILPETNQKDDNIRRLFYEDKLIVWQPQN